MVIKEKDRYGNLPFSLTIAYMRKIFVSRVYWSYDYFFSVILEFAVGKTTGASNLADPFEVLFHIAANRI